MTMVAKKIRLVYTTACVGDVNHGFMNEAMRHVGPWGSRKGGIFRGM
jgi:hypothetical protein